MLELDENKSLSEIFKDEDFEMEDEFSTEDELDSALGEIADLKQALIANTKSEPFPRTTESYQTAQIPRSIPQIKQEYNPQPTFVEPKPTSADLLEIKDELKNIKSELDLIAQSPSLDESEKVRESLQTTQESIAQLKNKVDAIVSFSKKDDFTTTVMHQLVKIKKLIGSDNVAEVQLNNELNELYLLEQKATRYVENDNVSYERKFNAIDDLIQRLKQAYNYDVSPIVVKVNELLGKLSGQKLTKESLTALESYLNRGTETRMSSTRLKELESYLTLSEKALLTTAEKASLMLDDIVGRKNAICPAKTAQTLALKAKYDDTYSLLQTQKDKESVKELRSKAGDILACLTALNIQDAYEFEKVEIQKEYKILKQPLNKSIYETITELKSIVSSYGITSADNEKTGIASDIAYIKEKIDIMQSEKAGVVGSVDGAQTSVLTSALTLESVVGQLDRLFEDVKNVVDAMEANFLDNLAIINDNVNIIKESVDKSTERMTAFADSVQTIQEIKEIVSLRYVDDSGETNSSAIASQIEKQNELISALSSNMEKMQRRMDELNETLSLSLKENAQLKQSVEKIFDYTEDNANAFSSVKNVLCELKNDVEELEKSNQSNDEELDDILNKIDEAIADKK